MILSLKKIIYIPEDECFCEKMELETRYGGGERNWGRKKNSTIGGERG